MISKIKNTDLALKMGHRLKEAPYWSKTTKDLLVAQEPPFWSWTFRYKSSNFQSFQKIVRVWLDWDICLDIYLSPVDHFQPLLGFSMKSQFNPIFLLWISGGGGLGQPLGGFWPLFQFRGPNYNWVKPSNLWSGPKYTLLANLEGEGVFYTAHDIL